MADRKRLIDKGAVVEDRGDQCGHQWAVEVVRHDNPGEAPAVKNEGCLPFEIGLHHLEPGVFDEVRKAREVTIDRHHAVPEVKKQARMASGPARYVENLAMLRYEACKPDDPR